MSQKPLHTKPSFYAYCFQELKEIAHEHGYNLALHGSLNRDLDLIAIPWQKEVKPEFDMIQAFVEYLGGHIMPMAEGIYARVGDHGRTWYVINIRRGDKANNYQDPQYYLDISVMPTIRP